MHRSYVNVLSMFALLIDDHAYILATFPMIVTLNIFSVIEFSVGDPY